MVAVRHKHADLMIAAAKNWDGLEWRTRYNYGYCVGDWSPWKPLIDLAPAWNIENEYQLRPIRPLFQQRVEVPKAETEAPITGTQFFFPRPDSKDFVGSAWWYGFEAD